MEICPGCSTIAAQAVVNQMPRRLSPTSSLTLQILIHLTITTIITETTAMMAVAPQIGLGEILAAGFLMDNVELLIASSACSHGLRARPEQTHGMTHKPTADARQREDRTTMTAARRLLPVELTLQLRSRRMAFRRHSMCSTQTGHRLRPKAMNCGTITITECIYPSPRSGTPQPITRQICSVEFSNTMST